MYNMFKCVLLKVPLLNIEIFRTFREIRICRYYMHILYTNLYLCLYVCLFVGFRPTRDFSLICPWRAANFDLCSALMAIEQWGFFCVPHLLWHGASVYKIKILKVSRQPDTVIYDVKGKKKPRGTSWYRGIPRFQ